jgi:hypothetical protein
MEKIALFGWPSLIVSVKFETLDGHISSPRAHWEVPLGFLDAYWVPSSKIHAN